MTASPIEAVRRRLNPEAPPTTEVTLGRDFRELDETLGEARERRTRRAGLAEQAARLNHDLAAPTETLRGADAALAALAIEAGVQTPDEIADAVQRSRERSDAEQRVREHENTLAQHAPGELLAEFIAAALDRRAGLEQSVNVLRLTIDQFDADVSSAQTAALEADLALSEHQRASTASADARQAAEVTAARLRALAAEYAALHLALAGLERAKEKYRAAHQDSMVDRAGSFFRTLTHGAYAGIDIDNDDGVDVLKAVRPDASRPDCRVTVKGLSDGTRDQLFLALRLAGIDQHLRDREPVPLVVDDVLVNFDDARTGATLRCLGDLAERTQVLLFTHHRCVVDAARAACPTAVIHEFSHAS